MAQEPKTMPKYVKFAFGGLAGMGATVFVQPLDLVKNRMQLSGMGGAAKEYKTSFHAIRGILQKEGIVGMYSGLSAGLLRQATYTTTRLGIYTWLFENFTGPDGTPPGFLLKTVSGILSGAMGAFIGNPADVALIRMAADGRLPMAEQRGYKNAFEAIARIVREEGFLALYTGAVPAVTRAMVVNVGQVVTYSQTKEYLLKTGYFQDNIKCHFVCSMLSGVVTVLTSMPVDIAKTRLQNMRSEGGKSEYTGMVDAWVKVVKREGVLALWKGTTPSYLRIGPQTLIFFLILENLTRLYKVHVLKDTISGGF